MTSLASCNIDGATADCPRGAPDPTHVNPTCHARLPVLAEVSKPNVLVAGVQQRQRRLPFFPPMGMDCYGTNQGGVCSNHSTAKLITQCPASNSATWYKELYDAYCSAQFIHSINKPTDVLRLINSENMELSDAALKRSPADDSLPARQLSIWMFVGITAHADQHAEFTTRALDALAHWSQLCAGDNRDRVANYIRLSVGESRCAAEFCLQLKMEPITLLANQALICVRWATVSAASPTVFTATSKFNIPSNADATLALIQQLSVKLCGVYDIPFPSVLVKPIRTRVPPGAYAHRCCDVNAEFAEIGQRPSCAALTQRAMESKGTPLERTGIFVRLCERRLGKEGVTAPTAFHGTLVGFANNIASIHKFVNGNIGRVDGLPAPLGVEQESLGLHVCAINVVETFLGNSVTLYGPSGCVGKPIRPWHSPPHGAWMWARCIAILPLDDQLLRTFCVLPCTPQSSLPAEPSLRPTHYEQMCDVGKFFLTTQDKNNSSFTTEATKLYKHVCWDADETHIVPCSNLQPSANDHHDHKSLPAFDVLLTSLQIDIRSARTTAGDVLILLNSNSNTPKAVLDTFISAVGELGVQASALDVFELCAQRIKQHQRGSDSISCNNYYNARTQHELYKRMLHFMLTMSSGATTNNDGTSSKRLLEDGTGNDGEAHNLQKRQRPSQCVISKEWIRRLLMATGISPGKHVSLSTRKCSKNDYQELVGIIWNTIRSTVEYKNNNTCDAISGTSIAENSAYEMLQTLCANGKHQNNAQWEQAVATTIARIVGLIIMCHFQKTIPSVFLLFSTTDGALLPHAHSLVWLRRVAMEPPLIEASVVELGTAQRPCVLMVQYGKSNHVSITGTVRCLQDWADDANNKETGTLLAKVPAPAPTPTQ